MTAELALHRDMRDLARECGITPGQRQAPPGDTLIMIHLGPGCQPEVARILRSQWKTITTLNYSEGREFHMRLRQYQSSGYYLVYGSVTRNSKNRHLPSLFSEVIQRGRLCRGLGQVKAAIPIIRQELGLPANSEKLTP